MAITNHIKGAVEKFKAKTGTDLQDHVLNATYLNGLEGTSYVDLTSAQTITGTKTFDVAYANVFATGTGAGNYFQCQKFRGEGNASTYYHALDFGYAGHNQWDFFEYGGIYNFYQNTTADGSGKVNLFQISPDGVTSHKPLIAESTLTSKGAFTSNASTTLSHIKNAGILGTDSAGKVYDNSSAYQKAGNYATKSDLSKYQPKGDYVTYDNASKDIYLGSHGIYSGARPSSGGVTMAGNGYWIKESSVGVSSAVTGGVAFSSEMTPNYVSVSNGKITINSSGIVSDAGTFTFDGNPGSVATTADLKNYQIKGNYVTTDTAQTITGRKTFNSPANVNGQEVATAIFKTSNGGRLIIGKEGPNSGTMLRFDQIAGTTRLQFRASATPGAMVWSQPEKGATLYFDLTNSAGVSTRTTLDARSGTIARTSDIGNGKITIQKNGTEVGSFTTNQSGSKTIDLTIGVSDVSGLQSTLNGKMDTYTITSSPSSMGKNGFAQFGYDIRYKLTHYSELQRAFGYVRAVEKGGQVSNNNSYFTGFGEVGGGAYIGTAVYDRDYNFDTDALYTSHGLLIDAYGSAFLLSGSKDSETIKRIATTDDTNSLQSSIDGKANVGHTHAISDITNLQSTLNGKQAKLVSGTNIKTINGNSILGGGDIPVVASLAEKSMADIINATSSKSGYAVIDKLLIQWGVYNGAHGDTTDWEVTYPKTFYWYPAVILQTKDTNTNNQGIPYSNGAVITSYRGGESFTFQLRRSETCPVYWIAIGGLR